MKSKNRSQSKRQARSATQHASEPPSSSGLAEMESIFAQALAFHRAGMLPEAETQYRRVLEVYPRSFDCTHLLGVISYQRGNYTDAIKQIDAALKINAGIADAHFNPGNVLKKLGRLDEALASYDAAAVLKPDDPLILNSRGTVLRELKRFADAVADLDAVIAVRPDFSEAFNNRGNVLKDMERHDEALADYAKAIALKPDNADAFNNRGNLHKAREEHDLAMADYGKAIALQPDNAEAYYNRGTTLLDERKFDAALADFDRALALQPDYVDVLYNRAVTLMGLGRIEDALAVIERVIALDPDHPHAYWSRAIGNLTLGRYRAGWVDYERRIDTDPVLSPWHTCGRPQWGGERDIAGKTLLLHSEQGHGDTIMAARYVRGLLALGARVILDVPPATAPLMRQIEGIEVVTRGDAMAAFDLHCPLMSLPRAFDTTLDTIPAEVPYLQAPAAHLEKWRQRLPVTGALRVGISWAGNPDFKLDKARSIELARMLPLLAHADIAFFSLQRDLRDGDAEILHGHPQITPLGGEIKSFADTAAIVSLLDLVISVDTSVAHVAGALARPVWVLLPFVPDWRWLLGRDDSPWYPTARLFRQDKIDDWSGVIDKVTADLARLSSKV
jgi:tetratricopeptide (TPR) repeat protein